MTAAIEHALKCLLQQGLPLHPRPYQVLAGQLGCDEQQVLALVQRWQQDGLIRRMGAIAAHHQLGYRANAMLVLDVPASEVERIGQQLAASGRVNLCYRRPRRPGWPYNLFCMLHGRARQTVLDSIEQLRHELALEHLPFAVLFSRRQFKQCAGQYFLPPVAAEAANV